MIYKKSNIEYIEGNVIIVDDKIMNYILLVNE